MPGTLAVGVGTRFAAAVTGGPLLLALGVAALAGLVSFASPCVLPLVPGYLSYVAGLSGADTAAETGGGSRTGLVVRSRVFAGALLFVLGFTAVFVSYGTALGNLGASLVRYQGPDPARIGCDHHPHGSRFPRACSDAAAGVPCPSATGGRARRCPAARDPVRGRVDAVCGPDSGCRADVGVQLGQCWSRRPALGRVLPRPRRSVPAHRSGVPTWPRGFRRAASTFTIGDAARRCDAHRDRNIAGQWLVERRHHSVADLDLQVLHSDLRMEMEKPLQVHGVQPSTCSSALMADVREGHAGARLFAAHEDPAWPFVL